MKINERLDITKKLNDGRFVITDGDTVLEIVSADEKYYGLNSVYNDIKSTVEDGRAKRFETILTCSFYDKWLVDIFTKEGRLYDSPTVEEEREAMSIEDRIEDGIEKMLDFFTEFDFTPNFRFLNTFSIMLNGNSKARAKEYVENYFSLMGNPSVSAIREKLKSKEFSGILNALETKKLPTSTINNRFKVYYGSAGTGKTTKAMTETDNRCIVCNSSMLPSDLMEDFTFKDGEPTFNPSVLWESMEEGKSIVLDEINLLPFDSLRFLQGILDGKSSFEYKGKTVHINDGFKIIGTMNLIISGMTFGLPEPLVDRAEDIVEFTLTPNMLSKVMI